jgi:hypothetical protein
LAYVGLDRPSLPSSHVKGLSKSRYCGDLRLKLASARGSREVQKQDRRTRSKTRVAVEGSDIRLNQYSLAEDHVGKRVT